MFIGRYETSNLEEARDLEALWTDTIEELLNATYEDRALKDKSFFNVLGKVFEQETLVTISYLHREDNSKAPICLFVSFDNIEDPKQLKKTLENVVKLASLIYDDVFVTEDWSGYVHAWTENILNGDELYYKITRENFSLTLQAEQILKGNI